jgi:hypothetical protein
MCGALRRSFWLEVIVRRQVRVGLYRMYNIPLLYEMTWFWYSWIRLSQV